jgi:thiamine biosynthesis lipoprotein
MIIRRQNTEDRIQNTEYKTQTKKNRKFFISFIWLLASGFWLLFLSSCSPPQEKLYKETRDSMYTIVSITVSSVSPEKAKKAINEAFKELDRLEQLLNYYSEESEITAINRKAGIEPVKVSPETFDIISKAVFASEKTKGAFDITMGPVIALWDFYNAVLPDATLIKEKLKQIGYTNIILDKKKSTVFLKKKGIEINPGGIIKGYAADRAVEILKRHGIKSGIVAVAGDIKTFGTRPDRKLWMVGIQNPRPTPLIPPLARGGNEGVDEILATIELSDMAISTSGDYIRYFIKDGKRYHHLLNPKTGYPAYECQSVTIIAEEAAYADAFATGIFILGPQKGLEVLKELGFDGVIVDKDGKIHVTEGIKDRIEFIGTTEQQAGSPESRRLSGAERSRAALKN